MMRNVKMETITLMMDVTYANTNAIKIVLIVQKVFVINVMKLMVII